MNQVLQVRTIWPIIFFALLSLVNSTTFDIVASPSPPSICCGSGDTFFYYDTATVSVVDPSPAGKKIRVAASLNFGDVCDIDVCLNEDCAPTVNPPLGVFCEDPLTVCNAAPSQLSTLDFSVNAFIPNGTNTMTFGSSPRCSSLFTHAGTENTFIRLVIVTCGDSLVEAPYEQCENTAGCDPQTCQCMPGYTHNTVTNTCDKNCGNGIIDLGEDCDIPTVGCDPNTCLCQRGYQPVNETCYRTCDDGVLQPQFEDCDGGVHCNNCSCATNYFNVGQLYCGTCGNNILDNGEECDGGVGCANCTCTNDYVAADSTSCSLCGNGKIDGVEQCEVGFSGCDSECKCSTGYASATPPTNDCLKKCGNGAMDEGELCEIGGTGCSDACQCQRDYMPASPPTKDCFLLIQDTSDSNVGTIAGAVVGSVVGAGLIALGVVYLMYWRKKQGKKSKPKGDKSEHEAELVDKSRPERVQSQSSLISDRSGTQLTSFNDTSTTENSTADPYLPTKSKTDLEGSEDIL